MREEYDAYELDQLVADREAEELQNQLTVEDLITLTEEAVS